MLAETAIQEFTPHVRGEVLCSADEDYEVARQVFNAMIDKRPALIARCAGAADVIECVRFAREHDLTVSVRGGGHSVAGKAVCDDGLMIDLSRLKGIRVDPARRTVRAEAGLTLVDIFAPTPYVDLQRMLDEYFPPGRQNYWKSNFLRALSDEAIDAFVECADQRPVPQVFNTAIWLEHMHGVAARVGVTETAFPHRQHAYNFSIFSIWPDPAQSAERMAC